MNDTTTIRVKKELYDTVKSLAKEKKMNIQDVVEEAIKDYKEKRFFEDLNAGYARLKADSQAWAEELAERAEWDATVLDGVEDD